MSLGFQLSASSSVLAARDRSGVIWDRGIEFGLTKVWNFIQKILLQMVLRELNSWRCFWIDFFLLSFGSLVLIIVGAPDDSTPNPRSIIQGK